MFRKLILFLMVVIGIMSADIAQSCPAFMTASNFPDWVLASPPQRIHLFALNPLRQWEEVPIQIDPMTDQNFLDVERLGFTENQTVRTSDRFIFYTDRFGGAYSDVAGPPCATSMISEIRTPQNLFGYLTRCDEPASNSKFTTPPPVSLAAEQRKISSNRFEYIYHPRNQLLYEALNANLGDGELIRSAYDADISLRLDIKNFFTMHFDNTDIEAYINSSKTGGLGVVQDVAFFLRLFAFKIDLKMNAVASFFESGANIPMLVDVPADASKHLNPGSGSLYSLKLDQAVFQLDHPMSTMPTFDPKLLKTGAPDIKDAGLRRCAGSTCNFKMMGHVKGRYFALNMTVPRNVVEMGFLPIFIPNMKEFKTALDWKNSNKSTPNERGIFFPTHGLSKGKYKVDSWILMGDNSLSQASCPAPTSLGRSFTTPNSHKTVH